MSDLASPSAQILPRGESGRAGATDRALARRAGLGDRAAFEELFRRRFAATYRYALHMLGEEGALAQDAAQDAWMKAWRHLPAFRGDAAVTTWLFTIVAREVADARRRRRPVLVDDRLLAPLPSRRSDDPEQHLEERELWRTLLLALRELPWRQRACWLLRELEGMSYAEIAGILDTTPGVVRGQLHRARAALAIRMEQWR